MKNWVLGKPGAFDLTVASQFNPTTLPEVGATSGSAAMATEVRKHGANDRKCSELSWISIPLVAETYGCWGAESKCTISIKSMVLSELYGQLNLHLVRANVRAILCRLSCPHQEYI